MLHRRYIAQALLLTSVGLVACSQDSDPAPESQRYNVRGVVRQMAEGPSQELYIHHEEIPAFVNIDGEEVGMGSMAMPFPVVDTPLPADLAVGDKVSFEFEVSWQGSPPMRLISLTKLDPETVLSFEVPSSDGTGSGAGEHEHGDHDSGGHSDSSPESESHNGHGDHQEGQEAHEDHDGEDPNGEGQ